MSQPRALTPDEIRDRLLATLRVIASEWARYPDKTPLERCEGAIFSTLVALDGRSCGLPGFDLIPTPHESDKDYLIANGENWIEPGTRISDTLHEHFYRREST